MMMYQCRLRCLTGETVGWIEERGAKVGNVVELKTDGQLWDVVEVFHPGIEEEALKAKQANDRHALPSLKGKRK